MSVEEKEFEILGTTQGLAESLIFRVELFSRGVGVVVEDFVVMQIDGVHDGKERVYSRLFHIVVPACKVEAGRVLGGIAVEYLAQGV